MKNGYIKVGCATCDIVVANPIANAKNIIKKINSAKSQKVKVLLFQELALSGYTCGDLFLQETLLDDCLEGLELIRRNSLRKDMLIVVGMPLRHNNKLFNVAAFINKGKILGFVPKTNIPNYDEFYELRHFSNALKNNEKVLINGKEYPLGTNLLFKCRQIEELIVACEICEDLWAPLTPSTYHALNGATMILNLSASNEVSEKELERKELVKNTSKRLLAIYMYSDAGNGESTQDLVFAAHNIISENGVILKESQLFKNELIVSEVDVKSIVFERSKRNTFVKDESKVYETIYFDLEVEETILTRSYPTCTFKSE